MTRLESILLSRGVLCDDEQPASPSKPYHGNRSPMVAVMTQQEVAERLGMDRRNVQAIEERALAKLRQEIEQRASLAGVSATEWMEF